ncbi:DUF1488 domain-containing protein [Shewanella sp. ENK2]|uniref:DUF1488 domain-containing protein n=1 Tax=Shewanella sp. ENK2 TaxID=2775245 RepID=UPI003747A745
MNQSILFTDIVDWHDAQQKLSFVAQVQGMNVTCMIKAETIEKLAAIKIENSQQALAAFEQIRFDIEDLAEELIESEAFDEQGMIQL